MMQSLCSTIWKNTSGLFYLFMHRGRFNDNTAIHAWWVILSPFECGQFDRLERWLFFAYLGLRLVLTE